MLLTPKRSSTSRVRSATSWLTRDNAAAPNKARLLLCPVRPKSAVGIAMRLVRRGAAGNRAAKRNAPGDLRREREDFLVCRVRDLAPIEDAACLEVRVLADAQARPHPLPEVELHAAHVDLGVLDNTVDDHHRALANPIHAAAVGHELQRERTEL